MKKTVFFILFLFSTTLFAQQNTPFVKEMEVIEKVLELDRTLLITHDRTVVDSFFLSHTVYNIEMTDNDYEQLKNGCRARNLPMDFLHKILPDYIPDPEIYIDVERSVYPVDYYVFSENQNSFDYYVVIPEKGGASSFSAYFFKGKTLIERHDIYQDEFLKIEYFKTDFGACVIYYPQLFISITGSFWENYFFYRYTDDNRLIPVLNELHTSHFTMPWNAKTFLYDTEITNVNPLKIAMRYELSVTNMETREQELWMTESTETSYKWNDSLQQYIPDFQNKLFDRDRIASFYLFQNELLFIHCFADELKQMLLGKDPEKSRLTSSYLNKVRSRYK